MNQSLEKRGRNGSVHNDFRLGEVVASVFTADGARHFEDWPLAQSSAALEYAKETSACDDVTRVLFENSRTGVRREFKH